MSSDEYELLKIFLDCHFEWYAKKYPTSPTGGPSQFLEKIEKTSLANAKKGLMMALNDIAEECANWTTQQIADADTKFLSAGTYSLSEIRFRFSKRYMQILKRGVIRSETEYYLIKGISDENFIKNDLNQNQQVNAMLADFEGKNL
jgi:hypothetical protein